MKQKKFWQKLIGSILAILLIVPFSFIKTKAITTNANYSLTQYNYYVEKQGTNWATTDIFVNFKAPASGTLTINISPTLSSTYYSFVVISGGNLAASPTTSTSKLTIGVRSQQNVQVRVQSISTQSNAHATYTMSFSGTYEDGEALSLENIEAELVTLNGKIDNTNNVLAQINTKLANISINDYTQILNTINTSIGSVQTAIEDLPDYTNVLNNINTYLGSINTNVADIETICSGIQTSINNILSTLQNIDNLIDTITWRSAQSNSGFLGYSTNGINVQTLSSNVSVPYETSIYLHFNNVVAYDYPTLYRFIIPFSYGNINFRYVKPTIEAFLLDNNSLIPVRNYELYSVTTRYRTYIYYEGAILSSDNLVFKVTTPNSGYLYSGVSNVGYEYIYSTDIEYWKIKTALQAEEFYKGNSETNQSISEQQSTNQNFENQSNQYHQLESTFQSNFNDAMENINPVEFSDIIAEFSPTFVWFTAQLRYLYEASGNFKILFTLPLLLGIALFFIGRGAQAMQHAEHVQNVKSYNEEMRKYREQTAAYQKHVMDYHNSRDFDWGSNFGSQDLKAVERDLFREN